MTPDAERAEAIKQRLHRIPGGFSPNDLAREVVASWAAVRTEATRALREVVEAAALRRNAPIHDNAAFEGLWVAVPKEDFDRLRAAYDRLAGGK